jgi:hypothetical protein
MLLSSNKYMAIIIIYNNTLRNNDMNYTEYINGYIYKIDIDEPLYSDDIAQNFAETFGVALTNAKKTVNVYLKRLADKGVLIRIKKGMYGRIHQSIFGEVGPNITEMAYQMFMYEGGIPVGYEAGPTLLNSYGLSTLLPKNYHIATNHYRYKIKSYTNVTVKKPFEVVTKDNICYLEFIEAIKAMNKYGFDAENSDVLLKKIIEKHNLDSLKLIRYAYKHCNDKELREIIRLTVEMSEDKNEAA